MAMCVKNSMRLCSSGTPIVAAGAAPLMQRQRQQRRRLAAARAAAGGGSGEGGPAPSPAQQPANTAAPPAPPSAPMAAGPRGARKAGKAPAPPAAGFAPQQPRANQRPIPIRGMTTTPQQQQQQSGASGEVRWEEGMLFPEGWEAMDPPQKLYQLLYGKRGFLYWTSQSAWYSAIILGVAWIVFRFVGPALGLYKLAEEILPPTGAS